MLATLPPQQRRVVVLRYYNDLPEQAVAEALGISVGAVEERRLPWPGHPARAPPPAHPTPPANSSVTEGSTR